MKKVIKKIVVFVSLATVCMHFLNKFISVFSLKKNVLPKDSGEYFEWRFGQIYYTKQGKGSPLLLVHDLSPYSSSFEWNDVVKQLSTDHTVYILDLLGCGNSDKPNITYTNYLYVQLISDFIKSIIGHKTDVIATGASSSFIIMACHMDQLLFNKIMMINPKSLKALNQAPTKHSKLFKIILELPIIGTFIYNVIMNEKNIEYVFTEEYFFNPFRIQQKYLNAYYESAHLDDSHSKYLLASIIGKYTNVNIIQGLKKINNSIFIIGGMEHPCIENTIDEYISYNHAIETGYINDSNYLPQMETPESLLDHIRIFL